MPFFGVLLFIGGSTAKNIMSKEPVASQSLPAFERVREERQEVYREDGEGEWERSGEGRGGRRRWAGRGQGRED